MPLYYLLTMSQLVFINHSVGLFTCFVSGNKNIVKHCITN